MRPMKGITMSELSLNQKLQCAVAGLALGLAIFGVHTATDKLYDKMTDN